MVINGGKLRSALNLLPFGIQTRKTVSVLETKTTRPETRGYPPEPTPLAAILTPFGSYGETGLHHLHETK